MKRIISIALVVSALVLFTSSSTLINKNVGTVDDPYGPKSISIVKIV